MERIRKRLTYANVMSSIAVFLILGGATAIAASKIGSHQLKANSVTTAKIKKNAVTAAKIKGKAVTNAKLADGSVNFAKIAAGTDVVATATGGPVAASNPVATPIPLSGTTTFTTQAGVVDFLSVEIKGNNLAGTGGEACSPTVFPYVNGNAWEVAQGFLTVRAFNPSAELDPSGLRPVTSETGPLGVLSPGAAQIISLKVLGDEDCTSTSTVSAAIVVTQTK